MAVGETEWFAAEVTPVWIAVPSVATVYQLMVFPADVAFKLTLFPWQIVVADGVTEVGAAAAGLIVGEKTCVHVVPPCEIDASIKNVVLTPVVLIGIVENVDALPEVGLADVLATKPEPELCVLFP